MAEQQNYSNHVKWVPLFHFFVLPVLLANFFTSVFRYRAMGISWVWLIGMLTASGFVPARGFGTDVCVESAGSRHSHGRTPALRAALARGIEIAH